MSLTSKAITGALKADATFAALVGSFLAQPAVFAGELAPPDAAMPYVLIKQPRSSPDHVLGRLGRRELVDLHAFIADGQGDAILDAIEERARDILDEPAVIPFSVPGHRVDSISVSAATVGPYEAGITSRLLTIEILLRRDG